MCAAVEGLRVEIGAAVFLPVETGSLWDIRQAVRTAVLAGAKTRPFIVKEQIDYYGGQIERVISQPELINEHSSCKGSTGEALHCLLLWDLHQKNGVLLHHSSGALIGSYVPIVTREKAFEEHLMMEGLAECAADSQNIQVYLKNPIPAGVYSFRELLTDLIEKV